MREFRSSNSNNSTQNSSSASALNRFLENRFVNQMVDMVGVLSPGAGKILKTAMTLLGLFGIRPASLEAGIQRVPERSDREERGTRHNFISRWASFFASSFKETHSHRSQHEDSEHLVLQTVAEETGESKIVEELTSYAQFVEEDGRLASGSTKAMAMDQPGARMVNRSHEVYQVTSAQTRLQASTGVFVNSPVFNQVSHQTLLQSRFTHVVADTYQQASQVSWQRAEKYLVTMSALQTRYGAAIDYHETYTRYSGECYLVSTDTTVQVGSADDSGNLTVWVADEITVESAQGGIKVLALNDVTIGSNEGGILCEAKRFLVKCEGRVALSSEMILSLHAKFQNAHSDVMTVINSDALITMTAPIILINAGQRAKSKLKRPKIPESVLEQMPTDDLKIIPDFKQPRLYLKEIPPNVTNRVVEGGNAPSPASPHVSTGAGGLTSGLAHGTFSSALDASSNSQGQSSK